MTKLYDVTGVCSLASHIALRETGGDFRPDKTNHETRITESGENGLQMNPKDSVPALQLDNDEVPTEGAVILRKIYPTPQQPWRTTNAKHD